MSSRPGTKILVGAAIATLALSSCGTESGDTTGNGGESITLGFPGTIGPTDTPIIAALNTLDDEGWNAEYIEFDSPDVQTQALMGGDINVASMGPSTVLAANDNGANLNIVGNNNILDYLIIGAPNVQSCSDLDDQTVAYHSEGSTSTAHLRLYLDENCPEAEPEFVVISGSSNRVTALLDGQIDGTIVRVEDWTAANADEDQAHIIDNLVETQAQLLTQTIVIDGEDSDSSGDAVAALMAELDAQLTAVNDDPNAFSETAADILEQDPSEVQPVLETLVDNGTFPDSHDLDPASVDATLTFNQDAGIISPEMTADQVADFELTRGNAQ